MKRILIIKYKCINSALSYPNTTYKKYIITKRELSHTIKRCKTIHNLPRLYHHKITEYSLRITFFFDKIKNVRIADDSDANFAHHLASNIWTVHTIKYEYFQILFTIIQDRCRYYIHICIGSLCNSLIVKKWLFNNIYQNLITKNYIV